MIKAITRKQVTESKIESWAKKNIFFEAISDHKEPIK